MSQRAVTATSDVYAVARDLFDAEWYTIRYKPSGNAFEHYLSVGYRTGAEPSRLFHTPWYRWQIETAGLEMLQAPLLHYLEVGANVGLSPHPVFDLAYYAQTYTPGQPLANAYIHFVSLGVFKQCNPTPLFQSDWYYNQYLKDTPVKLPPVLHYLSQGKSIRCNPGPLFDAAWYQDMYGRSLRPGYDPLSEYMAFGAYAGRMPNPLFDSHQYLLQNSDLRASGVNPLVHYLRDGAQNGAFPILLFDSTWYLEKNQDVRSSGMNPLEHYLKYGAAERRDPSPLFNSRFYLSQIQDSYKVVNPLQHYIFGGAAQGLNPHPSFNAADYARKNRIDVEKVLPHLLGSAVDKAGTADNQAAAKKDLTPFRVLEASEGYSSDGWLAQTSRILFIGAKQPRRVTFSLFLPEDYTTQQVSISVTGMTIEGHIEPGRCTPVSLYLAGDPQRQYEISLKFLYERQLSNEDYRIGSAVLTDFAVQFSNGEGHMQSYIGDPTLERTPPQASSGTASDLLFALKQGLKLGLRKGVKQFMNARTLRAADFDEDFYRKQLLAQGIVGVTPLHHYLLVGPRNGLDPVRNFSTLAYIEAYADVRESGEDPYLHFVRYGRNEGRTILASRFTS